MAIQWEDRNGNTADRRPVLGGAVVRAGADSRPVHGRGPWTGAAEWALIVGWAVLMLYAFVGAAGWL